MDFERLFSILPYIIIHLGLIASYCVLNSYRKFFSKFQIQFLSLMNLTLLFLFIGFRFEVGADWVGYRNLFLGYRVGYFVGTKEPLFLLVMKVSQLFSYPLSYQVFNLIMAALLLLPLYYYFNNQNKTPKEFIGFAAISFPFLVILLGMGYLRQGVACAVLLLAWHCFKKGMLFKTVLFCLLAASTHKASLLLLILPAMLINQKLKWRYKNLALLGLMLIFSIFSVYAVYHWGMDYVNNPTMQSKGVIFRLVYCLLLIVGILKRKVITIIRKNILPLLVLLIPALIFTFYFSTIVDRGLYFVITILFAEYILTPRKKPSHTYWLIGITLLGFLYGFAWLLYSNWATKGWTPYRSFLIDGCIS